MDPIEDANPKEAWAAPTMAKLRGYATRARQAVRRRPRTAALVAAGALVAVAGAAVAVRGLPDWEILEGARMVGKQGLKEAARQAREHPRDASAQKALGRAQFEAGHRRSGLRAYAGALSLDPRSADDVMAADLVSCYGRREQGEADALIARHKVVVAAKRLDPLASHRRHSVRWGAIRTLEKLGRATRSEYVRAWIADLDSPDCDVRRRAAEKLGEAGDRHALAKLRTARKHERDETPWYRSYCLGDRADEAERRILARR